MPGGYVEFPVNGALAERVVCTWIDARRSEGRAVLPDACIDLVWDGAQVLVAGPDTQAWDASPGKAFVGLRFRPGAAPGILRVAANELIDRTVTLGDVWGARHANALIERLGETPLEVAPSVLEDAVLRRLNEAPPADPVVDSLIREVQVAHDSAVVQGIARRVGFSPRSLHRRSLAALGYGPKTLDRILRFRRALGLILRGVGLAEAASRTGYADQAHLTNEFRRLGGATPGEFSSAGRIILSANGL